MTLTCSAVAALPGDPALRSTGSRISSQAIGSRVTKIATVLPWSMLGHHVGVARGVGEAPTDAKPAVVGEGAAQGRATRTGHCTRLTG